MKNFLLACVAVASSLSAFAQTDVTPVVNKYSGDLYISVEVENYDEDSKMDAKVTVSASDEAGKVDFSLPNFAFGGVPLGDIFLPGISISQKEDKYVFAENPDVRFNFLAGTPAEIVADAHLNETKSYIKGDSIVAYIPVQWIQSTRKTPIYVLFKGKVANNLALKYGSFTNIENWEYSKPWDSVNGYFDLSALDESDEFWTASGYTADDFYTPKGWCIANVTGLNGLGATVVGAPEQTNTDEDNPEFAVALTNAVNPMMTNQIVPGYMTLGTSWATANITDLNKTSDGGAFGGIEFKGKPDAIQFDYTRSHGDKNATEPATVIAYLWKGQYKQENVPGNTSAPTTSVTMYGRDRSILGMKTTVGGAQTKSEDAACIASVVKSIEGDQASFKTMTVDLNYGEFAGTDVQPDSLNIIFAANDYFGDRTKIGEGNKLGINNVKLLYYHDIKDVTYEGKAVSFSEGNSATLTSVYHADELKFTKVGEGAIVINNYDEKTGVLTIRVEAQNIRFNPEAATTYTIQFALVPEAINDAKAEIAPAAQQSIYTLDGRRADSPVKGVNIIGGKKVIK